MCQKRILVVDDEADFLASLAEILEDEGFNVDMAANGREALAKLAAKRPCMVIMDLLMPVMNGLELYAEMRADPNLADIPVIISTSDPSRAPAGAFTLKKPINLERMLAAVGRLC